MKENSRLSEARSKSKPFPANTSSASLSPPVNCIQDLVEDTVISGRKSSLNKSNTSDTGSQQKLGNQLIVQPDESIVSPQDGSGTFHVIRDDTEEPISTLDSLDLEFPTSPYGNQDQDLIPYLSASITLALKQTLYADGENWNRASKKRDCTTDAEDGYFEMGLPEGAETLHERGSDSTLIKAEDGSVHVLQLLWTFSIQLQMGIAVRQFASCLVLTDKVMAVFDVPEEGKQPGRLDRTSSPKLIFYCPYEELMDFGFVMPEICLTLKVGIEKDFFIIAKSQRLQEIYRFLEDRLPEGCFSDHCDSFIHCNNVCLQEFIQRLATEHQITLEDNEVHGCFPVCLLDKDQQRERTLSSNSFCSDLYAALHGATGKNVKDLLPSLLFLTQQNLIVLKIDFGLMPRQSNVLDYTRNTFQLKKIPLSSVVLHPGYKLLLENDGHVLQFVMDYSFITAFFVLPNDKFQFLEVYKGLRASLQSEKDVALFKSVENLSINRRHLVDKTKVNVQSTCNRNTQVEFSSLYPSEILVEKLSEENLIPFYLPTSSSYRFLSEMNGSDLLQTFHNSVSEMENEELRHLMWSSVIFYRTPDQEMTSCVLLSTKAIYFLLDDAFKPLNSKQLDSWNQNEDNTERGYCHLSYCFFIRFSDLQSVNIGLFDQYFRITGPTPSHVVTCITRDGYSTHAFIQQLMSALSLVTRAPSPEPEEKDFYSEFGNKNTGKMENYELIHSSRVKFIYPNEEEIGDLAFIVKEKNEISYDHQSLNILLYVLVFEVNSTSGDVCEASLQPKTLILTNSDLFLLNEDVISYPLPDFAKEPPKTDKYQLVDGRRIRDLDRVLLGYQTYPQTLTFVFDDVPSQDLAYSLSMDHFGETCSSPKSQECGRSREVQWYIFIPSADCREKLISLLARQWEILCGRELPLELTG
uniref:Nischarin n=1 Tax=Leptobrachium leishanense TaxID=445787 RepID=A0A8C5QEW4_9ANUR